MDSALKQRLLGAAVLIALAIIFVPMFLSSSPPKQDNTTLNLDIPPPPERKFETRTLPVAGPAATAPAAVASEADKVVTVDTKAPAKIDVHPEEKTAPAPATPSAAEPKSTSVAREPPPAVAVATADGRFAVNLGIYADQGHADALVAKLKKLGFAGYSETTEYQGKPALRVRVGPFADRAAAETARLKIKQGEPKVPSSVVESSEQPKTDAPAEALPANRAGGWAVQLGAFKSQAEANKLRDRLRGSGIASFVDRSGNGAAALWKVRAGPYVDRAGADGARNGIKQKFKIDGMIVTQP